MDITDEVKRLVDSELSLAGSDTASVAVKRRLEGLRITSETVVRQRRFLFSMFQTPCFPRGELVAVTGKKKCGKTYFCSVLMALCYRREVMGMRRNEDDRMRVVWIDTEQSEESTKEILIERVGALARDTAVSAAEAVANSVFAYNLRGVSWNERMELVVAIVREHHPDLVVFDGIRDVVDDINDGTMAQEVLDKCMVLASEEECCICCVLHQNKAVEDKTLRGALGTELGNKCFEEYECRKDAEHRMFSVEQVSTRKYDIMSKLLYTIGSDGLPRLLSAAEQRRMTGEGAEKKAEPWREYNAEYMRNGMVDMAKAFDELLPEGTELRAYELEKRFMRLVGVNSSGQYGRLRRMAVERGIIVKREVDPKCVFYTRGPKLDEGKPF